MKLPIRLSGGACMQGIVSASATFVFFLIGNLMGWPSPSIDKLLKEGAVPHLTSDEGSWVASCLPVGALLAVLPAGYLVDVVGRKAVLLALAVPFLAAWIIIIFAKTPALLYIAMILAGAGMGTGFAVGPMYLTEIAQDHIRGALATLFQVLMNVGILFSYSVGPYVSVSTHGIICVGFPILFVLMFMWMPESPYFYLLKGNREDAKMSLTRLRSGDVEDELVRMERFVEDNRSKQAGIKDLLTERGNRRALIVVVGLVVIQNMSGNNALLFYSTVIFRQSNKDLSPEISVIITGGVQVIMAVICSSLVDTAGRRIMLLVSTVGCTVALTVEGLFFYLKNELHVDLTGYDWVSLASIILFIIVYTVGLGPLPLGMVGELFPASVKGQAASIACLVMCAVGIGVPKLYQVFAEMYGPHVVFWGFAVCCVLGTVFVALLVPETKGKSLMEINRELNS